MLDGTSSAVPTIMFGDDRGFWEGIVDVATGRGQFRLILQPLIAILFGIKFGRTSHHMRLFEHALKTVIMPFTIAVLVDGTLQYLTYGFVRPVAALVMGTILVFIPFVITRWLVNRLHHLPSTSLGARR